MVNIIKMIYDILDSNRSDEWILVYQSIDFFMLNVYM